MRGCVVVALLLLGSVFDTVAAVRVRTRSRHRRSWDDTNTDSKDDKPSGDKVQVRAGTLLKARPHSSADSALLPCGSDGPCSGVRSRDIVVDSSKAPRAGVNYTAPFVDAEATREDHQIYSQLVRYRRTVDAIEERRDDRVQQDVHQLLQAARNELYQRDALGAQLDQEQLKAKQQLRSLDLLQKEYNKHSSTAGRLVSKAATTLRKFSTADDPPDTQVLTDLTKQVQTVQQHQHKDAAPSVDNLEKAIAMLAKHKKHADSSSDEDADDDADDDAEKDEHNDSDVDSETTVTPADDDDDDAADDDDNHTGDSK